jgi:hypothetical protein
MHRLLTEHRTLLGFQTLAVTWQATGGGVNNFASHSTDGGYGKRTWVNELGFRCFGSGSTKLQVSTRSPLLPQLPT